MPSTPLRDLIPVLQIATGPVILISGVGLLLLTLTNRFGRAVDRSRQLLHEMRDLSDANRESLARQVEILYCRARLIRLSITLATGSVLLASLLIIVLFVTALMELEAALALSLVFIGSMLALIGSLVAFLREIHLSLVALKLELGNQ